ncbi:MAG: response regulator, partial [Pseudomonadota bacterium]
MNIHQPSNGTNDAGTADVEAEFKPLTALIVDDSPSQRKMLALMLKKWKFSVLEAQDGFQALGLCQSQHIDFIISDWMMPEMDGLQFCRAVRKLKWKSYVYFILLTSRSGKEDVAAGLDAGADDFLVKPTDMGELHARLRAGQRLIQMQEALVDKNRRITEAFDRLNTLYQSIDRDLKAAAKLQSALIPEKQTECGGVPIGVAYRPAGHVGGDLVGFYRISEDRIAAYSIDVSGHGVSSALLTVQLANLFSSHHPSENIGLQLGEDGHHIPRDPSEIAADLNARLQDEADNDQYFTMLFADVNRKTGMIRFCQAGHPNPAILRKDGNVEFVGTGGAPVGLIPSMTYETDVIHLAPGERFMMF